MKEVATNPKGPVPLGFTVLRVPFFLEPDYPKSEDFEESNHDRLVRKWGGKVCIVFVSAIFSGVWVKN